MGRQRDIGRRERVAARRDRLRGAGERAKSAFLSVVSHELRTPLNTILGQAERLSDDGLPPHVREAGSAIRDAGEGLYALLNDLLELAKLEGGSPSPDAGPLDIRALVEGIRRMNQSQAWARELDLETEVDPAVPLRLRGDVGRIRQTLVNLTGNALKFTERGGVKIRVEMDGRALKIAVSDTGIGIDRRDQARMFGPFEQQEDVLTRRHGGLGLGLALCRRLVAAMGGHMGVESERGEGSTFWFTAPTQPGEGKSNPDRAPDHRPTDASHLERVRGLRVLAADDNPAHRLALAEIFAKAGVVHDMVETGPQAAEMAGRQAFDAIILDAHMPHVDGIQTARTIRTLQQRHKGAAILIACGAGDVSEADAAIVCDALMRKPYTFPGVIGALAKAVADQSAESFDASGILELEQTVGRPALIDILTSFLGSAIEMTGLIAEALSDHDSAAIERAARDLAGAAGGLGLAALTAAARELSQAARAGESALRGRAETVAGLTTQAQRALTNLYPDLGQRSAA